jgi:hypothetical protein
VQGRGGAVFAAKKETAVGVQFCRRRSTTVCLLKAKSLGFLYPLVTCNPKAFVLRFRCKKKTPEDLMVKC